MSLDLPIIYNDKVSTIQSISTTCKFCSHLNISDHIDSLSDGVGGGGGGCLTHIINFHVRIFSDNSMLSHETRIYLLTANKNLTCPHIMGHSHSMHTCGQNGSHITNLSWTCK